MRRRQNRTSRAEFFFLIAGSMTVFTLLIPSPRLSFRKEVAGVSPNSSRACLVKNAFPRSESQYGLSREGSDLLFSQCHRFLLREETSSKDTDEKLGAALCLSGQCFSSVRGVGRKKAHSGEKDELHRERGGLCRWQLRRQNLFKCRLDAWSGLLVDAFLVFQKRGNT